MESCFLCLAVCNVLAELGWTTPRPLDSYTVRSSKISHFHVLPEEGGDGFLVVFTVLNQVAMVSLDMVMHCRDSQSLEIRMQTTIESQCFLSMTASTRGD